MIGTGKHLEFGKGNIDIEGWFGSQERGFASFLAADRHVGKAPICSDKPQRTERASLKY